MSHRVEQIVDQLAALLDAHAVTGVANIEQHRVLSLSDEDQELPAISIALGEDSPIEDLGITNLAFIDSLQVFSFRIVVKGDAGDEEEHVITKLQDLRRGVHMALMADQSLGLSAFVIGTRYGGADAPVIQAGDQYLAGMLDCRWAVHYRMNVADPA